LASYLASSTETHDAFVEQVFHGMIKQSIRAYGSQAKQAIREKFVAEKFNLRQVFVEIIVVSALKTADANDHAAQAAVNTNGGTTQ
jgi:hypothetical protein